MPRYINLSITVLLSFCLNYSIKANADQDTVYNSESLTIVNIAPQTYLHISYLFVPRFGSVACNGLVCHDGDQSLVIDTPATNKASKELINWIQNKINKQIVGVVATHFHEDCLGGLDAFHNKGIDSYSGTKTQRLAKEKELSIPMIAFETSSSIYFGNEKLVLEFPGEGHTVDNIIAYFPKDKVMFGGCLIKSKGSGKGNTDDANLDAWSNTVESLSRSFGNDIIVVPGHGKVGGVELLRYTQELFKR